MIGLSTVGGALAWVLSGGWRYLAGAAALSAIALSYGMVWSHGHRAATAKCEAAALRAERDALKADLDNAIIAARDADQRASRLAAQNAKNEEAVRDYEGKLETRRAAAAPAAQHACALTRDDVERLRRIRAR